MYQAKLITHRGKNRIAVYFENKPELIARFKKLKGATWSATLKVWHLPDTPTYRKQFKIAPTAAQKDNAETLLKFKQWLMSRRDSENTIQTYLNALSIFFQFFKDKLPSQINNEDIIVFNHKYILTKQLSSSYQNQMVNAIKLYFGVILTKKIDIAKIHRPKREKTLPNVLSKEEIKAILNSHINLKHRAMLSLIYACGLRRSELLSLKPSAIDSKRGVLLIKLAKGKKDRIAPLSEKLLVLLREYYKLYTPKTWLFEGKEPHTPYSEKSLQSVLKQALIKARINKPVTLHWLRHSYATHLLDLRYIQELLGYRSSRTTEIYTHVSTKSLQNIKSPFDDL